MDVSHNFREGHRTFWRFDILTRGTVFQYGAVAVADPGEGPGGGLPLIFRPNWGPKGQKFFFLETVPPPLISGCGWFPPYLKVFIRHQEPITRRHWVGWLNSDLKYWLQVLPFSPPVDFQPFTLISLLARFSARPHWPHMSRRKTLLKNLAYRNVVI